MHYDLKQFDNINKVSVGVARRRLQQRKQKHYGKA